MAQPPKKHTDYPSNAFVINTWDFLSEDSVRGLLLPDVGFDKSRADLERVFVCYR